MSQISLKRKKISPAVKASPTHGLVGVKAAMMSWSRNLERDAA
jgi:hypothetical protein